MKRYRANYPRDEAFQSEGDAMFTGVNAKLAREKLPAGMAHEAVNKVFRDGRAATRGGCCVPVSHNPRTAGATIKGDFAVVTVEWTPVNGAGLYLRVEEIAAGATFAWVQTGGPAIQPLSGDEELHLNDISLQEGTGGRLSVMVGLAAFRADVFAAFTVRFLAGWNARGDGRLTLTIESWTGGTMSLAGAVWVNTGGTPGRVLTRALELESDGIGSPLDLTEEIVRLDVVKTDPRTAVTFNPALPVGGARIWGSGTYTDTLGVPWLLLATEERFWRCCDGRAPQGYDWPAEVAITGPCEFVSSAGQVLLMRGEDLAPLIWDGSTLGVWAVVNQMDAGDGTRPISGGATAEAIEGRLAIPRGRDGIDFTDILAPGFFDPAISERVRPGTGGDLARLFPYPNAALLAFKEHSIHLVQGLTGDLSGVAITDVNTGLGLKAAKAVAMVGADVYFLSGRGVFQVSQIIQDRIQTEPVPLSDAIEPLFRTRVNWAAASGAVAAVLGEYFYLALPFNGMNGNEGSDGNNVVLVYNTSTGHWEGWHAFTGLTVTNFERTLWNGEERLFAIDREAGQVALLHEGTRDLTLAGAAEIGDRLITRGYLVGDADLKVFERAEVTLQEWNASASLHAEGETGTKALYLKSRQRLAYFEFGKPAFVKSNVNDDHGTDGRQDYAVRTTDELELMSGVRFDRLSESTERAPVKMTARWVSLRVESSQGRCDVVQASVEARQIGRSTRRRE